MKGSRCDSIDDSELLPESDSAEDSLGVSGGADEPLAQAVIVESAMQRWRRRLRMGDDLPNEGFLPPTLPGLVSVEVSVLRGTIAVARGRFMPPKPSKPTIAARTESLVQDELGELTRSAGFRKKHLVFRRAHGRLVQVVQFGVRVTVSGGATPPEGFFKVSVGCGLASKLPAEPFEYDCPFRFMMCDGVRTAHRVWPVPLTRGAARKKLGREQKVSFQNLIRALDAIRTEAAARRFVAKADYRRIHQKWDFDE
jgi:hypothetical protein